jgi:hypothetical protein
LFYRGGRRLSVSDEGARLLPMVKTQLLPEYLYCLKERKNARLPAAFLGLAQEMSPAEKIKRSQPSAAPTVGTRTPVGAAEGCDLFGPTKILEYHYWQFLP